MAVCRASILDHQHIIRYRYIWKFKIIVWITILKVVDLDLRRETSYISQSDTSDLGQLLHEYLIAVH